VKQRENLMVRDKVTKQVMYCTMSTAVRECLHLCFVQEHLEKVKTKENRKLTTGVLWLSVTVTVTVTSVTWKTITYSADCTGNRRFCQYSGERSDFYLLC
jgi:hypothetical protein